MRSSISAAATRGRAAQYVGSIVMMSACALTSCSSSRSSQPARDTDALEDGEAAGATDANASTDAASDAGAPPSAASRASDAAAGASDAAAPLDAAATAEPRSDIPALLSQAGLYEADMQTPAAGVRPFRPRFELWSDGADKQRWIYLPEGAQIDTTSMEYWSYPPGTRIYKEFTVAGVRVETRLLHRQENGAWWMMAYQWRADQTDADAVANGVVDASGTQHDIPSTEDCRTCHLRMPDKAIGFSAIQLSHESEPEDPSEWTLARLAAEGRLTTPPPAISLFPDDELARDALGYLHANCGQCHQPRSSVSSRVSLSFWLRTDALGSVAETPTYATNVGQDVDLSIEGPQGFPRLIDPGSPDTSAVYLRMVSRGEEYSMPPLASEQVDTEATATLRRWIESLPPAAGTDAEPPVSPAPAPGAPLAPPAPPPSPAPSP